MKSAIVILALAALLLPPTRTAWASHGSVSAGGSGQSGPITTVSAQTVP